MKSILAWLVLGAVCTAGTLTETAERQPALTIKYELRKDKAYMVVRHPSGVVCLADVAELKAEEARIVLEIAEKQAELADVRARIKSIDEVVK